MAKRIGLFLAGFLPVALIITSFFLYRSWNQNKDLAEAEVPQEEQVVTAQNEDETAQQVPTAAPETGEIMVSEEPVQTDPNHCLECHTDKDRLIESAAPVEEKPEESSGAG